MSSWVDTYKKLVISSHHQHLIVADQDNLFAYDELKQAFEEEGYRILIRLSPLSVRLAYELHVRSTKEKFLIITSPEYSPLPDIKMEVQFKAIGLPHLFPNLDAKAIKGLSFNALCLVSGIKHYDSLGYEKTLVFLLENLYTVDFNSLTHRKPKERILNALITVLLEKNGINEPIRGFLEKLARPYFPDAVFKSLTKSGLLSYIEEQWRSYIKEGTADLDFLEPLLNRSIGYLFVFEHIRPLQVSKEIYDSLPKAIRIGVYVNEADHNDNELESLIGYLRQQLESIEDAYEQWFKVIQILANAKLKFLKTGNGELKEGYLKIERSINLRFQRFIDNTYGSLFTLSGVRRPVIVTRILEHMKAQPSRRKALLVIDGMNYWQWNILSTALAKVEVSFNTGSTLAYIPTITAWSRQAIFKGDKPDLSADNSKESKLFEIYWTSQGVPEYQIAFSKVGINNTLNIDQIGSDINYLGLVCNDLDDIMHGSILGDEQLQTSTEQWIVRSQIVKTIQDLSKAGFQLFITSDHGNIEAQGLKNLTMKDKVGALSRGKRHLHFTNEVMLNNLLQDNKGIEMGKKGLSVYLKNQEAFTTANTQVITHGGSHFWEVIVPFITIDAQ